MIRALVSLYSPRYPSVLVYMLQSTEYQPWPYITWFWQTQDFSRVEHRRRLVRTRAAALLLVALCCGIAAQVLLGLGFIALWVSYRTPGLWAFGLSLLLSYPVIWAHLIVIPLVLGRLLIVKPRTIRRIAASRTIFAQHRAERIAIVGSYGKTSMKELLLTVLSEGMRVAATPANKNVAISHAQFAHSLKGDEDVLIIEYGEGAPGDVAKFARNTHPNRAVITGVAAAHLDRYGSTAAAAKDIFSISQFVTDKEHVYVNAESKAAAAFIQDAFTLYDRTGVLHWKVHSVHVSLDGLTFAMKKGTRSLQLRSGLLGRHNIGPLALAAALASELGLSDDLVIAGVAKTKPFEHRMQPYELNGAWVIDDTYNGNIEGIRAGTALLKELPAQRKLYVTPGLVDQGKESQTIHEEIGQLIAASGAEVVVLMQNSVTKYIEAGLAAAGYNGQLSIEDNPLQFYTNLGQFVAAGDLIMLQNDWPDNYR